MSRSSCFCLLSTREAEKKADDELVVNAESNGIWDKYRESAIESGLAWWVSSGEDQKSHQVCSDLRFTPIFTVYLLI